MEDASTTVLVASESIICRPKWLRYKAVRVRARCDTLVGLSCWRLDDDSVLLSVPLEDVLSSSKLATEDDGEGVSRVWFEVRVRSPELRVYEFGAPREEAHQWISELSKRVWPSALTRLPEDIWRTNIVPYLGVPGWRNARAVSSKMRVLSMLGAPTIAQRVQGAVWAWSTDSEQRLSEVCEWDPSWCLRAVLPVLSDDFKDADFRLCIVTLTGSIELLRCRVEGPHPLFPHLRCVWAAKYDLSKDLVGASWELYGLNKFLNASTGEAVEVDSNGRTEFLRSRPDFIMPLPKVHFASDSGDHFRITLPVAAVESTSRFHFDLAAPSDVPLPHPVFWGVALASAFDCWPSREGSADLKAVPMVRFRASLVVQSNTISWDSNFTHRASCPVIFGPGEYSVFVFWKTNQSGTGGVAVVYARSAGRLTVTTPASWNGITFALDYQQGRSPCMAVRVKYPSVRLARCCHLSVLMQEWVDVFASTFDEKTIEATYAIQGVSNNTYKVRVAWSGAGFQLCEATLVHVPKETAAEKETPE